MYSLNGICYQSVLYCRKCRWYKVFTESPWLVGMIIEILTEICLLPFSDTILKDWHYNFYKVYQEMDQLFFLLAALYIIYQKPHLAFLEPILIFTIHLKTSVFTKKPETFWTTIQQIFSFNNVIITLYNKSLNTCTFTGVGNWSLKNWTWICVSDWWPKWSEVWWRPS